MNLHLLFESDPLIWFAIWFDYVILFKHVIPVSVFRSPGKSPIKLRIQPKNVQTDR